MRAPPLSLRPITGAPFCMAGPLFYRSFRHAFPKGCHQDCANLGKYINQPPMNSTATVTTPSPGYYSFSIPKSRLRCVPQRTYLFIRRRPSSIKRMSLPWPSAPLPCWLSDSDFCPPPSIALNPYFPPGYAVIRLDWLRVQQGKFKMNRK